MKSTPAKIAGNLLLAESVLKACQEQGVQDFCVCAGARNSPLVFSLERSQGAKLYSFFDERSAAFFATGRIQATGRPVAVITTSGTAVAELLPAAVEATYSGWPLLLITADRPRSYRGTGAPQAIDQAGILGRYVETCLDLEGDEPFDLSAWSMTMPIQINACFAEPLIDGELRNLDLSPRPVPKKVRTFKPGSNMRKMNLPLVIAGRIPEEQLPQTVVFLEKFGAPIYAEALSGLKGESKIKHLLLSADDLYVNQLFKKGYCQSVLRIGGIPTLRFWRDLEESFVHIPVNSVSELEFTGLSRSVKHYAGWDQLSYFESDWSSELRTQVFKGDQQRREKIQSFLQENPLSEAALFFGLAKKISGHHLYLGNSLPIREWDLVAQKNMKLRKISAARGANGIDGQLSAFLGCCTPDAENWAIVGDLTALYDLQSLWITSQLDQVKRRLVVINNKGGMIFKKIFSNDTFLNSHDLDFSHWAKMFGWSYIRTDKIDDLENLADNVVIELNPDAKQSDQFWLDMKGLT